MVTNIGVDLTQGGGAIWSAVACHRFGGGGLPPVGLGFADELYSPRNFREASLPI